MGGSTPMQVVLGCVKKKEKKFEQASKQYSSMIFALFPASKFLNLATTLASL